MFLRKLTYLFIALLTVVGVYSFKPNTSDVNASNTQIHGDTLKTDGSVKQSKLDIDEGIKCTRSQLLEREFSATGASKYGEILRITFQDLERGAREIIFQKKLMENDNVKFFMPNDLIKEANTAVLIVMKGDKMYFKKIDLIDEE